MSEFKSAGHARTFAIAIVALALSAAATPARAAVTFKSSEGWEVSFDGFVNAFAADETGSATPAGVAADPVMTTEDENSFRVRTGLLPGLFGFTVAAPPVDGLGLKARIGLYPQIQNGNTRNAFGSQLDLREVFFTVDGKFGQVLLGRALNLFQGKNILTDMTLFGVGVQGAVSAGGTTLGRIGYGYLYPNFGAQARYTTPIFSGLKLAVAICDPSRICSADSCATVTKAPGLEGELSYATKLGDTSVQAWVSGLFQRAWTPATSPTPDSAKTAAGGAAGVGASVAGVDLLASGFLGKGLGSFLLLDIDSLDAVGEEREGRGFLVQASYTFLGSTKLGVSYGQNTMDETAAELAARQAAQPAALSARKSWTGGLYHDVNKHLKVIGEYTHAISEWHGGQDQSVDVVAAGGAFMW